MVAKFPDIAVDGPQVDASRYVEPGTSGFVTIAWIVAGFFFLIGVVCTWGILLIVALIYPLVAWYVHRKAAAMIHGSGVRVTEAQFPEIYRCAEVFRNRLGVSREVAVYIVETNVANAFAVRYGKKNVILLTDDLIHGCLAANNPQILSFIIGHEMAHIALEHNALMRSWCARHLNKLGRLDEYSADAVATALVGDKTVAFNGLLLLTVGYGLLPYVNPESIVAQAREVAGDKYAMKAEKSLTHPLLLNRLYRVLVGRA